MPHFVLRLLSLGLLPVLRHKLALQSIKQSQNQGVGPVPNIDALTLEKKCLPSYTFVPSCGDGEANRYLGD